MRPWSATFLCLVFLTVESTRAALWAARVLYEPDHDGGVLRALLALLIGLLGMLPSPVWTIGMYGLCLAWIPVRAVLWIWGIGREGLKRRSPSAVTKWYVSKRKRRAETIRQRERRRSSL